ncbi:unnamed protein product [Sphagnum jensenii]|uniref:Uncharacterized protein n=1 Tax=Sphagnum jensenii TaxID=128206 RepID=A0ABP1AF58_9BRYO
MVISSSTDNLQHESNILTQRLSRVCSGHANNEGECLSSRTNLSVLLPAGMLMTQQNLNDSSRLFGPARTSELCRYFTMPGGCVRGDKCFYAHAEEKLVQTSVVSANTRQAFTTKYVGATKSLQRLTEDLSKKIFVGGLPPSVESDDLRNFFEAKFGSVLDAVVIGSPSGDTIQSRGFGFVTFKHTESVAAAVEAHYINLHGKKVEIKSAVPRCDLSPPEISRAGDFSLGDHTRFPANTTIEVTKREFFKLSPESSFPSASNTPQVHSWQKLGESQHIQTNENTACTSRLSPVKELPDSYLSPVMRGSSRSIQASNPSWLTKFLQWLPVFLTGVSMRLKEGDWYPLSSLKGDFRATCGLELDHLGLGYEKLSDFIRCLPDLCRMKIVPVGRGPATHMVLLPGLPQFAPTATLHGQGRPHSPFSTIRSSTDGNRTYADVAACQSASLPGKAYPVPAPPGFIPPVVASGAVSYPVPAAQGFIPPLVPSGAGPTNFTAPLQAGQPVDLTTSILQFETMSFAPPTAPSLNSFQSPSSTYTSLCGLAPTQASTPMQRRPVNGVCGLCSERRALFIAIPCGHLDLCLGCKDSLRQVDSHQHQHHTRCFHCYGHVKQWLPLQ